MLLNDFLRVKLLVTGSLILLSACSFDPVKPWQRGNLANDVMKKNSSTQHAAFETHSYLSKESNSGSASIGGGGCGCN